MTSFSTDEVFLTTEEVLGYLQINLRTVYKGHKGWKDPRSSRRSPVAVPEAGHRHLARQPVAAARKTLGGPVA